MLTKLILILNFSVAAPHPLTGSSIVNQPSNSVALAQLGFEIESIPPNWTYTKSLDDSAKSVEMGFDRKTILSFRSESVGIKTQLEPYVRQYLRDYNQYGFEVIGLQSYIKSSVPSIIVDLKQKNKSFQSRQVFFHKQGQVIIATCADDSSQFEKTFAMCNRILGTFKWKTE